MAWLKIGPKKGSSPEPSVKVLECTKENFPELAATVTDGYDSFNGGDNWFTYHTSGAGTGTIMIGTVDVKGYNKITIETTTHNWGVGVPKAYIYIDGVQFVRLANSATESTMVTVNPGQETMNIYIEATHKASNNAWVEMSADSVTLLKE